MTNKAIILHGTSGNSQNNWLPWLKKKLEAKGWQVWTPNLPDSDQPNMKKYLSYLHANLPFKIDENTTLIGHSSGSVAALGLLQSLPIITKIKRVILVSAFHTDLGWDKLQNLFNIPLDYNQIKTKAKQFIFIHSDNDPYVNLKEAQFLAKKLNGELRLIKNQGHFNLEVSPMYKEFPKLLAIALKGAQTHRLYLTSSFKFPGVADLVIPDIEKRLDKKGSEIKIAFITTAANLHPLNERAWIDQGRAILKKANWQIIELDIADQNEEEVREKLAGCNVIFVEGGQPIYMLEQIQNCNFEQIIRDCLDQGAIYLGESTGSIITGPDIGAYRYLTADKRPHPPVLTSYQGMNLVNFLIRPHWNRQDEKRQRYIDEMQTSTLEFYSITTPIIALNDNQLIYVEDDQFQIWSV
jgi:peptidase E/predicted alpha/beta hydrolase family esterase